jgi:hypothetical protein
MQARNPCEPFCLQKAWHAQFLRKEPRIVCAATPQMPSENQLRVGPPCFPCRGLALFPGLKGVSINMATSFGCQATAYRFSSTA